MVFAENNSLSSDEKNISHTNKVDLSVELKEVDVFTETVDNFPRDVFEEVFTKEGIEFLREYFNADIIYTEDYVSVKIKTRILPSAEQGLVFYADGIPVNVSPEGTTRVAKDTKVISRTDAEHEHNIISHSNHDDAKIIEDFFTASIEKTSSNKSEVVFRTSAGELI
ncbi:hypothetical protein Amet_0632 [Alkaliphilus metalliredigens QYMF]|uniref:Uncharacterized protein n=1 Tax=Alkaliphilus metalliredigens (strain QYMF) TaxID=293826 RepID=A6TKZ0_ALKMQ|nr:hypothetical protein [Alkaliphilus metalliredigens]ABR46858.1 hypothetical protein Amet_0632 [Alkaliphilus metalliredigens QYMF]